MRMIEPGLRRGRVSVPQSKSHAHRLLIANFLAGDRECLADAAGDSADIIATKRCLRALGSGDPAPILDCGESGSTLRFLAPVAAALGRTPRFVRAGRLAERPFKEYATLASGVHELAGDVSSQFVTGLLFALPLLDGDSGIKFTTPLESRGYVDMTLSVLRRAGIGIAESAEGFSVKGGQRYRVQPCEVEGDWSAAAFWVAMNALGSEVAVDGLDGDSAQPDRAIAALLPELPETVDVSQCPDIFPVLTVAAAGRARRTIFTGIRRLRLKECDRVAAMEDVQRRFGVATEVSENRFVVLGTGAPFEGGDFCAFGDHRIAMSIAVGATVARAPVRIDNPECVAKSYPAFFRDFDSLDAC